LSTLLAAYLETGSPHRHPHPAWQLQPAEAVFERNSMAAAHGLALPELEPLFHFAGRQDVIV
jgi:hypothetical protein